MNFRSSGGEPNGWVTVSSQTHYEDAHLSVVTEEVRTPGRARPQRWTVVRRKAAVVIAPLTAEGKLVLIREERIPIRQATWAVPAGQIDDAAVLDETACAAVAQRELREETGYRLADKGKLTPLGHFFLSPGFTDERGHFFVASPVEPSPDGHAHEEAESILDCRAFSAGEIVALIIQNEIRDANTLSICAKLIAHGFMTLPPP